LVSVTVTPGLADAKTPPDEATVVVADFAFAAEAAAVVVDVEVDEVDEVEEVVGVLLDDVDAAPDPTEFTARISTA
jgi:hypothetical protein